MSALLAVAAIVVGGAIYFAIVFYANRRAHPLTGHIVSDTPPPTLPEARDTLSVMTWNIGYGALGKNADLIVDKGRSLRALSAKDIASATRHISQRLASQTSDVLCLQENANPGFLTRNVPVRQIINEALSNRHNLFWSDMKSVLVPRCLRIDHGMSVHSRVKMKACFAVTFPQDSTYFYGGLTKHYGGLISRISITNTGQEWVVFNIHLSAFNPDERARLAQLQNLMRRAQHEYDQGHFVVIAGDWNMRLTSTNFAHRTDAKDLFILMELPQTALPVGWNVAIDPNTPTVRSLNSRFVPDKNYTTVIDGFIYSPNIALDYVSAADLGFKYTDHQPVEACFRALK